MMLTGHIWWSCSIQVYTLVHIGAHDGFLSAIRAFIRINSHILTLHIVCSFQMMAIQISNSICFLYVKMRECASVTGGPWHNSIPTQIPINCMVDFQQLLPFLHYPTDHKWCSAYKWFFTQCQTIVYFINRNESTEIYTPHTNTIYILGYILGYKII